MYIPARHVLYVMSALGFFVNYMLRTDLNLAMVAMVKHSSKENEGAPFDWSTSMQNAMLSSFYWINPIAQFTGGWITEQLGCRIVYGSTQFVAGLCSLLIPFLCLIHPYFIYLLKIIQGLISGTHWPAMYSVVGHWIPFKERSRFMSSFQCFNAGIGVTYIICGGLIQAFGWQSAFYFTSGSTIIYCVFWVFLVYDTPNKHPRISEQEKEYIQMNLGGQNFAGKKKIPYKAILLSPITWSLAISNWGRIVCSFIFYVTGPQYMKYILHFKYARNGFLTGFPFVLSFISSVLFGWAADVMIDKNVMKMWNVRRLMAFFAQVIPGLICFAIPYTGCNGYLGITIFLWFCAAILGTASSSGTMATPVDISPNFAGTVIGLAQTVHITACPAAPLILGAFVKDGHTCDAWRNTFFTVGGIAIASYFFYFFLGSADVQPWNKPIPKEQPELVY